MARIQTKVLVWHEERTRPDTCEGTRAEVESFLYAYGFGQGEVRRIMNAPLYTTTNLGDCEVQVQQVY